MKEAAAQAARRHVLSPSRCPPIADEVIDCSTYRPAELLLAQ
jgi:hypothetical protein